MLSIWVRLQNAIAEAKGDEGQALVEYALILALIAVVAIGALQLIGGSVTTKLNSIGNSI